MSDEQVFIVRVRSCEDAVTAPPIERWLAQSCPDCEFTVTEAPPLPPLPAAERWVVEFQKSSFSGRRRSGVAGETYPSEATAEMVMRVVSAGRSDVVSAYRVRKLGDDE